MEIKVVKAEEGMIDAICAIEQECFSLPWSADALRAQLDEKRHVFLAAVSENRVIGYVGLMFVLDEGYISNVAVSGAYRRLHAADALIAELERVCRDKRLSFMSLEVRKSNLPAISLYEKHGFEKVGLRRDYYEKPREDAVIMTKFFD